MRISTPSAALVTLLCTASADASTLVRVRMQSRRKSLLSSRVRRDVREVFLDYEPAFSQLELSMVGSISASLTFGGVEGDNDGQDDEKTEANAALTTAEVETVSGAATIVTTVAACAAVGVAMIL
ncbi:hypothetical protein ACHAW5_010823 [Stephanodiscus triporus]|uniref:Uncharacterized protein n=1 Tax=Stephanodiscus triporus TaxID=2934178 RepID=A0ABD3MYU1_9STRA